MLDPSRIISRVEAEAERRGWLPGTLCQHAGVGFGYFERLQQEAVSLRTMRRLADWLDVNESGPLGGNTTDGAPVSEIQARAVE